MAATLGNSFWKARSSHGRTPIFASPDELWCAAVEYFEHCEASPLYEAKAFAYEGMVTVESLPKMRAMTLDGLCTFLDIGRRTWGEYQAREDFSPIVTAVERVIRDQKFTGAAAGLLNANIIARDLGLSDKQELTGANGGPIETKDVSARDILTGRIAGLAARTGAGENTGGTK